MKLLFSISCLLIAPFCLSGQDVFDFTGTWEGILTQEEGGYTPEYSFKLVLEQDGMEIKGRSFVKYGEIYAEMELEGRLIGNRAIHWEEIKLLDNWKHEHMEWCYKRADLFVVKRGAKPKLEGPWSGNTGELDCVPGKIKVARVSPRV